ncbi:MAG: hypothetical protein ACOYK6_08265 [Chthoniobacterales bacterium]
MNEVKEAAHKEAITSALAAAFGTAGTVLIVEFLHLPNAYIALSLAGALSLLPMPSFQDFLFRIGSVTLGILSGVLLITTLPQSPWVYFFSIGFIAAVGYHFFLKYVGAGAAYIFSAYFAAMCVEAITGLFSSDIVITGLGLLVQSIIPIVVTYSVTLILKRKTAPANNPILRSPITSMTSITLTVWIAILVAFSIKTNEPARLVIASVAGITALETERSTESFRKKMLGYVMGAVTSISFIVVIVASTNDLTIYLLGLGFVFGFLEWLANYYTSQKILFRAISIMFAYSALMLPAPDSNLHVSIERVTSSFIGFSIAILVFLFMVEVQKITILMISPKSVVE